MPRIYTRTPIIDRISRHVTPDPVTGCWMWTGACSKKRHGERRPHIRLAGRQSPMVSVARFICEQRHGPAPTPDHEAGHTCPGGERARCVAPDHLVWMSRAENEQYKRAQQQQRRSA